jgi:hypothetical protein
MSVPEQPLTILRRGSEQDNVTLAHTPQEGQEEDASPMEGIEEAPEARTSDALKGAAMPKPNPEGVVEAQPMVALKPTGADDEAPTLVATKMVEQEIKTTPPHKAGIEDEDEKECGIMRHSRSAL